MSFLTRLIGRDKTDSDIEQPGEHEPAPPGDEPRFRRVELTTQPLGPEQIFVSPASPRLEARLLSPHLVELLRRCHTYETLDAHARRLCGELRIDATETEAIARDLAGLAEAGLLAPRDDLFRAGTAEGDGSETTPITAFGMVTCNRPAAARRGLETYARSIEAAGGRDRDLRYLLCDDSKDEATAGSNAAALRELAAERKVPCCYAGVDERRSFVKALAAEGLDPEVVDFALFGMPGISHTGGANRNALSLATAGEKVLSVDDDTYSACARPGEPLPGLGFSSRADPTQFCFFDDQAAALAQVVEPDEDLLALPEEFLGRSLSACAARFEANDGLDVDDAADSMLRATAEGRGKVVVTSFGQVGDSGMASTRYYVLAEGATRDRLLERYDTFSLSRAVQRCAPRPTISTSPFFMSTAFAIDGRGFMAPPFLPVVRNHDGVFGVTLRQWSPDDLICHLPFMLAHEPPNPRSCSRDRNVATGARFFSDRVVIECIRAFNCPGGEERVAERARALGRHLQWLGGLGLDDFEQFLLQTFRQTMAFNVQQLERLLDRYGEEPAAWADDVLAQIAGATRGLTSRELAVPVDLAAGGRTSEEALLLGQQLVCRFGDLLHLWPDIWAVTLRLRESGVRLGRKVGGA